MIVVSKRTKDRETVSRRKRAVLKAEEEAQDDLLEEVLEQLREERRKNADLRARVKQINDSVHAQVERIVRKSERDAISAAEKNKALEEERNKSSKLVDRIVVLKGDIEKLNSALADARNAVAREQAAHAESKQQAKEEKQKLLEQFEQSCSDQRLLKEQADCLVKSLADTTATVAAFEKESTTQAKRLQAEQDLATSKEQELQEAFGVVEKQKEEMARREKLYREQVLRIAELRKKAENLECMLKAEQKGGDWEEDRAQLENKLAQTSGRVKQLKNEVNMLNGRIIRIESVSQEERKRARSYEQFLRKRIDNERAAVEAAEHRTELVARHRDDSVARLENKLAQASDRAQRLKKDSRAITLSQSINNSRLMVT